MDHRLIQFDRQLRQVVGPALAAAGFLGEAMRCWRREVRHERTVSWQVVEFEIGTGSLSGHFIVNLGIFNADHLPPGWPAVSGPPHPRQCLPDLNQRLDRLTPQATPHWLARALRRPARSPSEGWKLAESPTRMQQRLERVLYALDVYGLTWLDSHTSVAAFTAARDRLQAQHPRRQQDSPARD